MPRYWTVDEAKRALPEVVALLRRLQAAAAPAARPQAISPPGTHAAVNGHGSAAGALPDDPARLLHQLNEMGVEVKDIATGLIDFPHRRRRADGTEQEVLLCYRLGEPELAYWHDTTTGFAGRRPLSEL